MSFANCPAARSGSTARRRINPVLITADKVWFFIISRLLTKIVRLFNLMLPKIIFCSIMPGVVARYEMHRS